jgi:molybdate transport system ATP-binding protein
LTIESIQLGRVVKRSDHDLATVAVGNTLLSAVASNVPPEVTEVYVCIRGDDVMLVKGPDAPSSPRNHLPSIVQAITREGALIRVDLDCGFALSALLTKQACEELSLQPGDRVLALVKAPRVHLIPR